MQRLFALVCYEKNNNPSQVPPPDTKSKKPQPEETTAGPMVVSKEDARKILLALRYDLDVESLENELTLEDIVLRCK